MSNNFTIQQQIDYNMFTPNTLLLLEAYKLELEENYQEEMNKLIDEHEENAFELDFDEVAILEQAFEHYATHQDFEEPATIKLLLLKLKKYEEE